MASKYSDRPERKSVCLQRREYEFLEYKNSEWREKNGYPQYGASDIDWQWWEREQDQKTRDANMKDQLEKAGKWVNPDEATVHCRLKVFPVLHIGLNGNPVLGKEFKQ